MIRVGGEIRVPLEQLEPRALEALRRAATVTVESRQRNYRTRLLEVVRRPLALSRVEGGALVLPRGLIGAVRRELPGVPLVDERAVAPCSFRVRVPLREHQRELAQVMGRSSQGLAILPTGSGKTGAALAVVAAAGQRVIVVAPTIDLARQWVAEVSRFLGVDAGLAVSGKWSAGHIVVATVEAAIAHTDKLSEFGVLIVDECHLFATDRRVDLIAKIPARVRLGLTATLPSDHRGEILRAAFGPVRMRRSVSEAVDAGHLVVPRYEQIATRFAFPYAGPDSWPDLLEALAEDEARNGLIVDTVARECAGRLTLVLSARLAHLDALEAGFQARGLRVARLAGDVGRGERAEALEDARAGRLDVLLGSTVADAGIDLPDLGAVALTFPGRSEARQLQRIGRAVRMVPGKGQPVILDFVDDCGPLRRQAELRERAFRDAFGHRGAA